MRRGTVGKNHNRATAAQVNTHLADHFHKNCLTGASQVIVILVVLHAVPYIRESLRLENILGSLQSCSVMVCAAISWYSIPLIPLLSFMAKLLQGIMWTGWAIRRIPWSRHFWTTKQFSKDNNVPIYPARTVHSLKSMKVNFSIFPGQNNHLFWRLVWGTNISKATLRCSFRKNGIKFC
jgi:hypothetical protein